MTKRESIINFAIGQTVRFNPDNHLYDRLSRWEKARKFVGQVKNVNEIERTVSVKWADATKTKKIHYSRLIII